MKRLSVLYPLAIVLSLTVALILVSGPAQAYIYDNFPDTTINTSLWNSPIPSLFSNPGGYLLFNDPSGGQDQSLRSLGRVTFPFFVSIDYSNYSATNASTEAFGGSSVLLWVGYSTDLYAVFETTFDTGKQGFRANSKINGTLSHLVDLVPSTVTQGRLGIGFNGILGSLGVLTLWYDDGSGWTELASVNPNFISDPFFAIEGYDTYGTALTFRVSEVDLTPVPLPPSLLLLGSGLLGLGALGWRRQRA